MAYTTSTFTRMNDLPDGRIVLVLTYTGNAGEVPVEVQYPVAVSTPPSADFMRGQAIAQLNILNQTKNFKTGATPFIGTVLDTTTPLPVVPPTAQQTFLTLWGQYQSAQRKVAAGVVAANATEVTTLHDAVVAAYAPAFVGVG